MLWAAGVAGQDADTLPGVKVKGRLPAGIAASSSPVQEMNKKDIQQSNSLTVADAVKFFPGVLVRDYGGIGGLKTISVRSLGANHTGVLYDGMIMGDARAGLIDLGRISTENLDYIRLYQSGGTDALLPARSYASANLLVMATSTSFLKDASETWFSFKAGSFGLINPSAGFAFNINDRASLFVNGEYQRAHGGYNYKNYFNSGRSERKNGDVNQGRLELDLPVRLADSSLLKAKVYYHEARRGLPGSVVLYNETANEWLDNTHLFAQINWRKRLSAKWNLSLGAKSMFDRQKYSDPDFLNNEGYLENDFHQYEHYVTAAFGYALNRFMRVSFSSDYFMNTLKREDAFDSQFAEPSRKSLLTNIALTFTRTRISADANLLYTGVSNRSRLNGSENNFRELSPAASASLQPLKQLPLRFRAMFKEIFRPPSLDDLFFTFIGNAELRPERSRQYGVGLTWESFNQSGLFRHLLFTADGYFVRVNDKIIALPRTNLFQWSMMNVGKAETRSVDLAADLGMHAGSTILRTNISYSYQNAEDVTQSGTPSFKRQLVYIPVHSGSARLMVERAKISASWNVLFSGDRYRAGDQNNDNLVKGYLINDLHFQYSAKRLKSWNYTISLQLNNILNEQYDVVKYFPMPGFNWRVSFKVDHKKIKK